MLALFTVVTLIKDMPTKGLIAGMIGTVIDIYSTPTLAYEVEFCDSAGKTIVQLALSPNQIQQAITIKPTHNLDNPLIRMVGFHGGSSMFELGTVSDMQLFFDCIDSFVVSKHPETDWSLITDRLYAKYLRREDLQTGLSLMKTIENSFATTSSSMVDWNLDVPRKTKLNHEAKTLDIVFARYFVAFSHCSESAQLSYEAFGKYLPRRTGTTDVPHYIIDKNRRLTEYDSHIGKPFWQLKT